MRPSCVTGVTFAVAAPGYLAMKTSVFGLAEIPTEDGMICLEAPAQLSAFTVAQSFVHRLVFLTANSAKR